MKSFVDFINEAGKFPTVTLTQPHSHTRPRAGKRFRKVNKDPKRLNQQRDLRDQGYRWDDEKKKWVKGTAPVSASTVESKQAKYIEEAKRGRESYEARNPDFVNALLDIFSDLQDQNLKKGMTLNRFTNQDVIELIDQHKVYGINGTNPWPSQHKERYISNLRRLLGVETPGRKQRKDTGKEQGTHDTGDEWSDWLKPEA